MENKISNYAIILASGSGSRYGADLPKQFSKIGEKTILEYTLSVFENNENIDKINTRFIIRDVNIYYICRCRRGMLCS